MDVKVQKLKERKEIKKMVKSLVEVYEVMPDNEFGGWKVLNSNKTCLKRTRTKREAVRAGQERARARARDFGPSRLSIRLADGRFDEQRNYTSPQQSF